MSKSKGTTMVTLPDLPYGEGSMSFMPDGKTIIYKKTVNGKRVPVYGETVQEVLRKMKQKEKESKEREKLQQASIDKTETLKTAMERWIYNYKSMSLKGTSLDRLERTVKDQIIKHDIANYQIDIITSDTIQSHMQKIISEGYSYSVVKKTYESFNDFFGYYYAKTPYLNPMLGTVKPTQSALNVLPKDIGFYDDKEIETFVGAATRPTANNKPYYKYGWGVVAILFTGLRSSEAISLRWEDINFNLHTLHVKTNIARVVDRSVQTNNSFDADGQTYKRITTSTKTRYSTRIVNLTQVGEHALQQFKKYQNPTNDNEYVFATKKGTPLTYYKLRDTQLRIQSNAGIEHKGGATHILRHSFCSLMARKGVDKRVVADILGQGSTQMIEKIYQHVTVEEKTAAIKSIDEIYNMDLFNS